MSEPYIGQVVMVGFNFAPPGWLPCDGRLLSIADNQTLFTLIGVTYGGDGQTSFALPDLRGRVPVHQGQLSGGGTYPLGLVAGNSSITLTNNQLPAHTHMILAQGGAGNQTVATNGYFASTVETCYAVPTASTAINMASSVSTSGGSQPHDNLQPYLGVNYIIATEGVFPSPQ